MTNSTNKPNSTPYLLIVYYSLHGSTRHMANMIARGVDMQGTNKGVTQIESRLRTVPSVSTNIEASASAIPNNGDLYCSQEDLNHCSGLLIGSPTRFGNMSAAMKYFLDGTVSQWANGDLTGKPAGVFTSTSSMHGGQESTLLSMMLPLFHQGMVLAGLPYSEQKLHTTTTGGTPYGPSHLANQEAGNVLSNDESELCVAFGKRHAKLALKLAH